MIRNLVGTLLAASLAAPPIFAQERRDAEPGPWDYGVTTGLNLAQSSFSGNWAGGDKGSIVWVVNADLAAERQFSRIFNLSNLLQIAYGQTSRQVADPGDPGGRVWDVPEKSTDLIALESVGRFSMRGFVDPYFSLRLDSQFSDESNPVGRIPLNPVKLKETAGIARVLSKDRDSEAITRLGFGFRQTFARSFVDSVTRARRSFTALDGGFEWQTSVTRPILDGKVLYKGKLLVFQPLFYSKSTALETFDADSRAADPLHAAVADFWKATDVNFQNSFSAQITTHLSVILYVQWIYDKFDAAANVDNTLPLEVLRGEIRRNVRKAGQFKETLALGLTYRLL